MREASLENLTSRRHIKNDGQRKPAYKLPKKLLQTNGRIGFRGDDKRIKFTKIYKRMEHYKRLDIVESHDSQHPGRTW